MRIRWLLLLVMMVALGFGVSAQEDADPDPLTLVSMSPEATDPIYDDTVITLTFNQALDCGTVSTNLAIIPEVATTLDCDGDAITIEFSQPLQQGAFYTVRLREGLTATSGATLGQPLEQRYSAPGYLSISEVIPADSTASIAREAA